MPPDHLKFRCYRCNQLLAVAASRAGTIVACPKCKADLQIPGLESVTTGEPQPEMRAEVEARPRRKAGAAVANPQSPAKPAEVPTFIEGVAGTIPADVAELRPEDLRVEAEFFESLTQRRMAAEGAAPGGVTESESLKVFPSIESAEGPPAWPTPEEVATAFTTAAPPQEELRRDLLPPETEIPIPTPKADAVAPPIEIETPAKLQSADAPHHIREVIMPASVVLMWSLFGLAGLAFSFIAGLMIGHFLWRVP
jgi:phage FluMu protein Com